MLYSAKPKNSIYAYFTSEQILVLALQMSAVNCNMEVF